ncbi:unnamed protein product [Urochloa humidicola]
MSCLGRAALPAKRVWRGLSACLRRRRATGLSRLRKEVRTCKYSDVHVMWEMLSTSNGNARRQEQQGRRGRSHGRKILILTSEKKNLTFP